MPKKIKVKVTLENGEEKNFIMESMLLLGKETQMEGYPTVYKVGTNKDILDFASTAGLEAMKIIIGEEEEEEEEDPIEQLFSQLFGRNKRHTRSDDPNDFLRRLIKLKKEQVRDCDACDPETKRKCKEFND